MLRFRSFYGNGAQELIFIHGFRQLALYSTSISTQLNPNFVNYLVENLGFSQHQALLTSSKLSRVRLSQGAKNVSDFTFVNSAGSTVAFLQKIGLEQSDIRNAVVINPRILLCNVDKTLIPKIEALQKLGFSGLDIAKVISFNPSLFLLGLNTTIVPAIQVLREIMGSGGHGYLVSMLEKIRFNHSSNTSKYLVANVAFLKSYGIPVDSIRKVLCKRPSSFLRTTEFFRNAVTIVEQKLGIPRKSPQFLNGLSLVTCLSEKNLEAKVQAYKSFGWTDADIATHLLLNPSVLSFSSDSIKRRLDFLMNELGYEPSYLASKCNLFTCSLEKRLVPRHKVLLILKEKGLMNGKSLPTVVCYSESKFLAMFVLPFKEVHEVYSKFAGINLELLTLELKPNLNAV